MKAYFNSTLSKVLFLLLIISTKAYAQESVRAEGKFITFAGAKIYYEEYGQGEPLLLLHGFGGTSNIWDAEIKVLKNHFRVIAWDMRGHGRSTNPDTSTVFLHETAAKDLLHLIKKLQLKKVKLMGHSSGGIVALYAAVLEPGLIEAIIPVSAQTTYSPQVRDFIASNATPEVQFKRLDFEKSHGKEKGMLLARQFYHFKDLQGDPSISPKQLATIKARTLIVHGDNDFVPVSGAWEMFTHIPNARIYIVPNGWHAPHMGAENSAEFLRRTLEFLKGDFEKTAFPK
jgi:pimeloyl-ACP methyl ester carboxylesterase